MSTPEERLAELGLEVPEVAAPVAAYVPAVRSGDQVFTSGQLPMRAGELMATGVVGAGVTPEEAENWPHKNVIVRALGMKESVQVDILTEKPHVGDTYLLCSDGPTGMIKDDQMHHIINSERDLDRAVDRLITAANEEGGVDNISVVLARVEAG